MSDASLAAEDVRRAVRDVLGADVQAEVTPHRSGALSVDLRRAGRYAVIERSSSGQWAADADPPDAEAFTGHRHQGATLQDALSYVRDAWTAAPGRG